MQNVTIVVLFFSCALVLLGSLNFAEGAVSWNGFLKEVGFDPPSVYEVSDSTVILAGETENETLTLLCDAGDWMDNTDNINFVTSPPVFEQDISILHDTNAMFVLDPASLSSTGIALSKRIGYSVEPELLGTVASLGGTGVTVTIVCLNPQFLNPDFLNP